MGNIMVTITFKFCGKPANLVEIKQSLQGIKDKVIKIDGCLAAQIYQNIDDKREFLFTQEWEKQKVLDDHKQTKLFAALLGTEGLMEKEVKIGYMVRK